MKKNIALLISVLTLFTFTACNRNNDSKDAISTPAESLSSEETTISDDEKEYSELNIVYNVLSNGTAEVAGYSGEGNHATIDSEYDGHDVTNIADSAFEGCSTLESVLCWAEIKEIGAASFKDCSSLTEISIPNETTIIGDNAFEGCTNLSSLIIWGSPDIGNYAFSGCTSLSDVSISAETKNVGAHAFDGCTGMTSLIIWGVDSIGDYAFSGCTSLSDVSIPNNVKSIGNHAFDGCVNLESVMIWDDSTLIGKDAFANCSKLDEIPQPKGTVPEYTPKEDNKKPDDSTTETHQTEAAGDNNKPVESSRQNINPTGIRPEFKEAMDSYEAFFDEYIAFIKKYSEASDEDAMSMLSDYLDYMSKYNETMKKMNELEDSELSKEEALYYAEVSLRISQKLLEVAY